MDHKRILIRLVCQKNIYTRQVLEVVEEDCEFYICEGYRKTIVLNKDELYTIVKCKDGVMIFGFDEGLLGFIYLKYLESIERKSGNEHEVRMLQSKITELKKKYRFILEDFEKIDLIY